MTGSSVSAVTAYTAHREWASRPPDERYASVHALYEAARARRTRLEERPIETADFRTEATDTDDVVIRDTSGQVASLTHWSFGQLATIASAPPSYLRTLPAEIASEAINYGLQRQARDEHQLFVERTAPRTVHAITSPRYARVHHHDLAGRVLGVRAEQQMLVSAVLGSLPRELERLDQDQACWCGGAERVVCDRISRESDNVGEWSGVERDGGRRIE